MHVRFDIDTRLGLLFNGCIIIIIIDGLIIQKKLKFKLTS